MRTQGALMRLKFVYGSDLCRHAVAKCLTRANGYSIPSVAFCPIMGVLSNYDTVGGRVDVKVAAICYAYSLIYAKSLDPTDKSWATGAVLHDVAVPALFPGR